MAQQELLEQGVEVERKWGLILHGIALMTRTAGSDASGRSAHDGSIPVGRALFSAMIPVDRRDSIARRVSSGC